MPFFRRYGKKLQKPDLSPKNQNIPSQYLISSKLVENMAKVQDIFSDTPDLVIKNFVLKQTTRQVTLIYIKRDYG